MKIDRILSLSVIGGLLDGSRISFSPGLNCVIGARGTGKTTILELIRYTLDALPKKDLAPAARKRVESLVEGNLQGGRVELEIETKDGLRYCITRSVGEAPIVLDADRNPTGIVIGGSSFFRADIFSQNEVETIADHGKFQLELLDSFAPERIEDIERECSGIIDEILLQARMVEPLLAKQTALTEELKQLPAIEEKLKGFAGKEDKTSKAIGEAHSAKALRDQESRLFEHTFEFLGQFRRRVEALPDAFIQEFQGKFTKELLSGPNGKTMAAARARLLDCMKSLQAATATMVNEIEECGSVLESERAGLTLAHSEQEIAFRELVEKHKQHQAQSAERAELERKRNSLIESKSMAAGVEKQIADAGKVRAGLLARLSEARDKRFAIRKEVAERLNSALSPNITVSIQQDGNAEAYQELLESSLRGHGIQQGVVAQKLVRSIPPARLAALVRDADTTSLMESGDLNPAQAAKVITAFQPPEKLAALETVALQDAPSIRLRVGGQEKDSVTLSTGQKCTTILPILLLEGGNPLLIDQPEDNLDNRFIFETVVANIQKVKPVRQLIFVTHNPNIPVLGEASRVFVMESDGERAGVTASGSVDECRSQIVNLLEGGAEAFRRRGEKYLA